MLERKPWRIMMQVPLVADFSQENGWPVGILGTNKEPNNVGIAH